MSILGSIISSIFGKSAHSETLAPSTPGEGSTASAASKASVDVAAILDNLAAHSEDNDLDWRKSIVDLMKILKLDSSFAARKQLAQELNYTGSTKNSAQMNMWLHKQVMAKLVENGGKLPSDLHR
jgi:hypothetical protein